VNKSGSKPVTIYHIADEAGVSIGTVSRVINGKALVSQKTRNRIQKVIQKYKYSPSQTAQSMVHKKSKIVGILIPQIRNPFFAQVVGDIDKKLYQHGYSMLLYNCEFSSERELRAVDDILGRNADGIIFLSSGIAEQAISEKIRNRIHVVACCSGISGVDYVDVTNQQAFFDVTEHLISLGHRDIAFVGGNAYISSPIAERANGYFDALRKYDIPIRKDLQFYISGGNDNMALLETKKMLALKHPPTAIVAMNDYNAIDVYQAISEMGLQAGRDIAVTGCDNIPFSTIMSPSLTTIDLSIGLIAEMLADFLLKRMLSDDKSKPKEVIIPGKLIKRDSSGAMRT
jgi:DNA-binding LacI/PurR family transcriptional regulator